MPSAPGIGAPPPTAASKEAELAPLKAELAVVTHECEAAQRASGGQTKEDRRLAAAREETLLQMQIKINALLKQEESAVSAAQNMELELLHGMR